MKFQAFHMNPGEKLKKKDVDNDLSNFMSVFPTIECIVLRLLHCTLVIFRIHDDCSTVHIINKQNVTRSTF